MICTHRAHRLPYCVALAACLSAGALVLVGCVQQPVNTNAHNIDTGVARNEWEKKEVDPAITADTFYAAGQLAESQEMWAKAIEQYDKALKLNKDHLPSLYRLGVIYARHKQYPQAILIWKHYLTATNGDPTAYANIGFCYELSGSFEEAQDAYESGIRRDPNNAPCRVNYGLMLVRRGRFNQAMHEWQVVLPPAEVYYNMGSAYEAMDRREQAKIEFHKALEIDPQLADARARLERLGDKVPAFEPPPVAQANEAPEVTPAPTTAPSEAPVAEAPATDPSDAPVAEAPTTAPSDAPVAEAPTTAPSDAPLADAPDTKPVEEVEVPTTAPSAGSGQARAEASAGSAQPPSTQPLALTDAPTTAPSANSGQAPSTQPTASAATPTTAPVSPEVDITEPPAHN